MRTLPLGWATDIAVLEHMGSTVDDRGDHLVVRTARNPEFHWGNCVFVTDPDAVDNAGRWVEVFDSALPEANWIAIGLPRIPADAAAWAQHGLDLKLDDVLATSTLPRQTPQPDGYVVRALAGEDWEQLVARELEGDKSHERFVRARTRAQRDLCERGVATFVGAFCDGRLVAELGIVRCGSTARYQNVGTDPRHRRRGIASHLLGAAAVWAADRGCRQWVIVTEASNPSGRVYRNAGFEPDAPSVEAYRPPGRFGSSGQKTNCCPPSMS
jgi:GNAT superfamily N-acetyltransferase